MHDGGPFGGGLLLGGGFSVTPSPAPSPSASVFTRAKPWSSSAGAKRWSFPVYDDDDSGCRDPAAGGGGGGRMWNGLGFACSCACSGTPAPPPFASFPYIEMAFGNQGETRYEENIGDGRRGKLLGSRALGRGGYLSGAVERDVVWHIP